MKKIFLYLCLFFLTFSLFSQNKVILEVGEHKVNTDEFLYFFSKNSDLTAKDAYSYEALQSYMELFKKFKMKVFEAEDLKMDTSKNFQKELNGYRSKLAQPYLTDKENEEEAVREYYNRISFDVNASHILIGFPEDKEDTIEAYHKIWDIYNELEKGADFEELAIKYSEDKSVVTNKGNLGFSSVDQYVYPFENAMYETPVGQISKPFATSFGYHIVKVIEKAPTKGKYKVAHIMRATPPEISQNDRNNTRERTIAIFDSIKNNTLSFEDAVEKYSEDRRTAVNNGELGWVEMSSRYIPQFKKAVFNMNKIGDITMLETNYGFHIIKLLEKEDLKPYEEMKTQILSKIQNTIRTRKSKTIVLEKIKKEYNFTRNQKNIDAIMPLFTDSLFKGTLVIDNIDNYNKTIFTIADKEYLQKDFIDFMMKYNRRQKQVALKNFIVEKEKIYIENILTKYEESRLEEKYPEFKNIIAEYHDGMLLFQISDEKVWGKALKDTVGLRNFYNENKTNYNWDFRYKIAKYECKDMKTLKSLQKMAKKNANFNDILTKLNKKDSSAVLIKEKYFAEKNTNKTIDNYITEYNIPETAKYFNSIINQNTEKPTITTINVVAPETKLLSEAKGIVTADYQKQLEEQWLNELSKKYNVIVHEDVLKSLVK